MIIGIFGTGRNGSTLLGRLLDGMENTYMHPVEMNFISAMDDIAHFGKIHRLTHLHATTRKLKYCNREIESGLLIKYYKSSFYELKKNYIDKLEQKIELGNDPVEKLKINKKKYLSQEFVKEYLKVSSEWIFKNNMIEHYCFKSIETPYIKDYEKLIPDMRFIHIIRDPVNAIESQKRTLMCNKSCPWWYLGRDYLETMIEKRWLPHACFINGKEFSDKHILVKYEDLIVNPRQNIKKICKWLNLNLPGKPDMQTVLNGNVINLHSNTSKKGIKTPIKVEGNLQKKLNYGKVLTKREERYIEFRTMKEARKIGYFSNSEQKVNKMNIVFSWLLFDKWEIMYSTSVYKLFKTFIALFYRRFYISTKLIFK
jgi:hypothetical protein